MEVGEVVIEELDELEAEDRPPLVPVPVLPSPSPLLLVLEFELDPVELRMVDEVTDMGGVQAETSETGGEPEPLR